MRNPLSLKKSNIIFVMFLLVFSSILESSVAINVGKNLGDSIKIGDKLEKTKTKPTILVQEKMTNKNSLTAKASVKIEASAKKTTDSQNNDRKITYEIKVILVLLAALIIILITAKVATQFKKQKHDRMEKDKENYMDNVLNREEDEEIVSS